MELDELVKWGLIALAFAFVFLAAYLWRRFTDYKRTVRDLEARLAGLDGQLGQVAKEASDLAGWSKTRVTSADVDSAFTHLMEKV
ncbi:MAG TPA: DUF948 domain-containing protein, partial [Candidatus Norongarragalinales archaeon]|nr:DUF948 domain-containing protein [Candidatus Norongarragalinales archaeon]